MKVQSDLILLYVPWFNPRLLQERKIALQIAAVGVKRVARRDPGEPETSCPRLGELRHDRYAAPVNLFDHQLVVHQTAPLRKYTLSALHDCLRSTAAVFFLGALSSRSSVNTGHAR